MKQAPAIVVIVLACSATLSVYLSAYARFRKRIPGAKEFGVLALGCAFYTAGYAIEISRFDLQGMLWAIRIEYLGLASMPIVFLFFTLRLLRDRAAEGRMVALLSVVPVATVALVWTSGCHSLYYVDPRVEDIGPYMAFAFERGPWYAVQAVYQICAMVAGFVVTLVLAATAEGKKRCQALTLAIGASLPIAEAFLYLFRAYSTWIDPGPLVLTASCLIYAFALFKLGLLELVPAARAIALDSISEGFLVVDSKGRLQDLNRAARSLPGFGSAREGEPLPSDSPLTGCVAALVESDEAIRDLSLVDPEGGTRRYEARSYPVLERKAALRGKAVLVSDITERSLLLENLDALARTDYLTGLPNRRSLLELGAREIERSRRSRLPLGVIMADLDLFKSVNDRYGHDAGDETLKMASSRFAAALRSIDVLGRYGGEEFVVFLPGADMESSRAVAERIRESIESSETKFGAATIRLTVSIGVLSLVAGEDTEMEACLTRVDEALYRAKEAGRNRVWAVT
jgi:diguanylate cyclase (GGDEF)-like protein